MTLCERHDRSLRLALELRGLGWEPAAHQQAAQAITAHCQNFAGSAAIEMNEQRDGQAWCPLCFVNQKNPARVDLDEWITYAADERLAAQQQPTVVTQ